MGGGLEKVETKGKYHIKQPVSEATKGDFVSAWIDEVRRRHLPAHFHVSDDLEDGWMEFS